MAVLMARMGGKRTFRAIEPQEARSGIRHLNRCSHTQVRVKTGVTSRPIPWSKITLGLAILAFAGIILHFFNAVLENEIEPPPLGIVAEKLVSEPIDYECIHKVMASKFGNISYMLSGDPSEGSRPYIIYYQSSDRAAYARLRFTREGTATLIHSEFFGYRHPLPQSDFPPAIRAMRQATDAISTSCHLDLSSLKYREVGQRVDALH